MVVGRVEAAESDTADRILGYWGVIASECESHDTCGPCGPGEGRSCFVSRRGASSATHRRRLTGEEDEGLECHHAEAAGREQAQRPIGVTGIGRQGAK